MLKVLFFLVVKCRMTMEDDSKLYRSTKFIHKSPLIIPKIERNALSFPFPTIPSFEKESERSPMKFEFDTSGAFSGNDPIQCKKVGQVIDWKYAKKYVCKPEDILTDEKKKALTETLNNVNDLIGRTIRVKHESYPISEISDSTIEYKPINSTTDSDHYVYVIVRPFESTVIGASVPLRADSSTNRIIQSHIFLHPMYIPTAAESEKTQETFYFNILVHEMMHSIGLQYHMIYKWINRSSGLPYSSPIEEFTRGDSKKVYTQLCTPKCMEVAQRRAGKTHDKYGHRICLELEDGGGPETALSHPKATLYNKDLMAGIASYDSVLSEVLLAMIEDMGWYTVNWSNAQQMTWGAPELLSKEELDIFVEKPTHRTFPDHYKVKPNEKISIGHDHKTYDQMSLLKYDKEKDLLNITMYGDLYIPEDGYITPNPPYDYVLLKNLAYKCHEGSWAIYREKPTDSVRCMKEISCNQTVLELEYNGERRVCTREKETISFNNEVFSCPDPNYLYRISNYLKEKPHDYGHITLLGDMPLKDKIYSVKELVIIGSIVLAFLLIATVLSISKAYCPKFCNTYVCCLFPCFTYFNTTVEELVDEDIGIPLVDNVENAI